MEFIEKLKLDPSYLNFIDDDKLSNTVILFALEMGYDYKNDKDDRFCKYDIYLEYNIYKNEQFIDVFLNSKHFNINSLKNNDELRLKIVNYALEKGIIDNQIINNWFLYLSDINKLDIVVKFGNLLYIKHIDNNEININLPTNIEELYCFDNDIDYINKLVNIIKKSKNGLKKIVVKLPNRLFNNEELDKIEDKDFVIFCTKNNGKRFTINAIKKINQRLDYFVKDINESSLSPYEKYIAVYNIVKSFKKYAFYKGKEEEDIKYPDESRNIYAIIDNDYMVCVGFAKLLEVLLSKVGINSISYSRYSIKHQINYVHLKDKKYNIDGYYFCDVTNDSIQKDILVNGYENLHFNKEKIQEQINEEKSFNNLFDKIIEGCSDDIILNDLKKVSIYNIFMNDLSELDPIFYETIKNDEINMELAHNINNYIRNKTNSFIEEEKDIKAIIEIKQFIDERIYDEKEYNIIWNDIIINNNYSINLLRDYQITVNEYFESLKGMKIIEYYSLLKSVENSLFLTKCLEEAYKKLEKEQLNEDSIESFLLCTDSNNNFELCFCIAISDNLYQNDEVINVILESLKNEGYNIEIVDDEILKIYLDKSYYNKNFLEIYDFLSVIKNDYLKIYNNQINVLN